MGSGMSTSESGPRATGTLTPTGCSLRASPRICLAAMLIEAARRRAVRHEVVHVCRASRDRRPCGFGVPPEVRDLAQRIRNQASGSWAA